jgi:WD40 repeat protein
MRAEECGRDDDPRVNEIVSDYVDRMNAGERITAELVLREEPLLAGEILDALQVFFDLDPELKEQPLGTLGDYTLRRQIGRGGMGVVYEAWENSMDRRVALKVLPPGVAADERALQRFVREAKTAGQLTHPNVVGVYGMGLKEQTPYFAMEFVEGETLAQVLTKLKDAAPETETPFGKKDDVRYFANLAEAFADVSDGLQHAHSKGIIHRDIKPSNLILDTDGRLRILDFGLARLDGQESLTISGDVVGTPLYMSPEQARRRNIPVDHRTDVYSLGATLYDLLTLRPPFQGKDHHDTLSQIIERDAAEPRKVNPRVPKDLETIVLKCLRKDAGDRYRTAEAMGQDLRRFVRGDAVEARPESRWDRAQRWARRHRAALGATGAVLVLAIAGLAAAVALVANAYDRAVEERDARTRELYISDMRLAMVDWETGSYSRCVGLLERHRPVPGEPDLRGWEWYYLQSLREEPRHLSIQADPDVALALAWHPGGSVLATGGADGFVKLWDAGSGLCRIQLSGDGSPLRAIAWSPTGKLLACLTEEAVLRCWDAVSQAELFAVEPDHKRWPGNFGRALLWNKEGTSLVVATGDGPITVRDARDGTPLRRLSGAVEEFAASLSWGPDERYLAAAMGSTGEVVVWSTERWEETARFKASAAQFYNADWSPDGSRLVTSSAEYSIKVWGATTWTEEASFLAHHGHVFGLAWSPDGKSLASGGQDGVVKIWRTGTWQQEARLIGHAGGVGYLAWNPAGTRLASAGKEGKVIIWDIEAASHTPAQLDETLKAVSPDGRWLATQRYGTPELLIRDAAGGPPARKLPVSLHSTVSAFSGDSRLLAATTAEGEVVIWEWQRAAEVHRLGPQQHGEVRTLAWRSDGHELAVAHRDGAVQIRDAGTWELAGDLRGHETAVDAMAWSPDSRRLATTSTDLELRIWDATTWKVLHRLQRAKRFWKNEYATSRQAIGWSPDGRLLAGTTGVSLDGLTIWDAACGQEIFRGPGHVSGLASVAWSPDGRRMVTGGYDGAVKLWDMSVPGVPRETLTLTGHRWVATAVGWDEHGRRLITGAHRQTMIWDASAGFASEGE